MASTRFWSLLKVMQTIERRPGWRVKKLTWVVLKRKKKVEIVVIFSLYIQGDCYSNFLTFFHPILGFKDKNKFSSRIQLGCMSLFQRKNPSLRSEMISTPSTSPLSVLGIKILGFPLSTRDRSIYYCKIYYCKKGTWFNGKIQLISSTLDMT